MPEICRFWGIIIRMYDREHPPPHFHAFYGEYEGVFRISDGKLLEGDFPVKETRFVAAWASMCKEELKNNWDRLQAGREIRKINPPK